MIRSETLNSKGTHQPPKSSIVVNGVEQHPNVNGHTVVLVNYKSGNVESVKNFRTDIDPNASASYAQYLQGIQSMFFLFGILTEADMEVLELISN